MKINYNITGMERKSLVGAISRELNAQTKYLGAPTFAYEIGDYNIDKTGTLTGGDNRELVAVLRSLHCFVPAGEEYDTPAAEAMPQQTEDFMPPEYPHTDGDTMTIELPKDGFTETAIANLRKLVDSKAALIKKAFGLSLSGSAGNLPIEETDNTLRFPWFVFDTAPEAVNAYSKFIDALCVMAKDRKRITAKEKEAENEKYAFRCFLLRLGFIGNEYKDARKILLANLEGNGAFKKAPGGTEADTGDDGIHEIFDGVYIPQENNGALSEPDIYINGSADEIKHAV